MIANICSVVLLQPDRIREARNRHSALGEVAIIALLAYPSALTARWSNSWAMTFAGSRERVAAAAARRLLGRAAELRPLFAYEVSLTENLPGVGRDSCG